MRGLPAAVLAAVALASGCAADGTAPSALPRLTTTPSAAVSAPAPTPSGIHAPDAFGASAFTRHFFATLNAAYRDRQTNLLAAISHEECTACNAFIAEIGALRSAGRLYEGGGFVLKFAEAPPPRNNDVVVDVAYDRPALIERDAEGAVVGRYPRKPEVAAQVRLLFDGRWLVRGVREVAKPA